MSKGIFDPTIYIMRTSLSSAPEDLEDYICDYRIDEENNILYYYSREEGLSTITLTNDYLFEQTGQDFTLIEEEIKKANDIESIIDELSHPLQRFKAEFIASKLLPV